MMNQSLSRLCRTWQRLWRARRGNVLMIFGFALIPLTVATGMTVDYARAARSQTRLNAVLDAAALAGVTPDMIQQSRWNSIIAAYQNFYAQAGMNQCQISANRLYFNACNYVGNDDGTKYTFTDGTLSIVVTDKTDSVGFSRTILLSYDAKSENIFGAMLGMSKLPIGGTTTTNAKTAPNTDFYVMLDTSGSMAFPATSAGITLLRSKTGGCAFACHSTNDGKALNASGVMTDYYGVATSFNIPLRVDEAKKSIASMMSLATTTSQNNHAVYRAGLYTFAAADTRTNNFFTKLKPTTTDTVTLDLTSVGTAANAAGTSLYYTNNCPTSAYCNGDIDTASSDAFTRINAIMPAPGNGTNAAGDKPQEVLFIVTDGMRDEYRPGGQPEVAFDTALCTTIKNRGIRIAILYTEFLQSSMDGDAWSQTNVVPNLYKVEPALTACASPGLMYKVTTDDDISTALNKLFLAAVTGAHIVH